MTEGVYSVRGAARRVHRSRRAIQYWIRDGLPHRRLGPHRVEIDEADLTAWLRQTFVNQKSSRFRAKDLTATVFRHLP